MDFRHPNPEQYTGGINALLKMYDQVVRKSLSRSLNEGLEARREIVAYVDPHSSE